MHSSMEGGMDPSLITRPLECVPRTPWRILPLDPTAFKCIYSHRRTYFGCIFRKRRLLIIPLPYVPANRQRIMDPLTDIIARIIFLQLYYIYIYI